MSSASFLGSAACAAVALAIVWPMQAAADPLTDFLCNSGSTQFCPPPPPLAGNCHPSYDPCVERNSDVDCLGGDGNGPGFTGPVRVIGPDEYDLDRNNDGRGCENS
ncbi:hypothetical protein ACWDOP_33035 [Nocardia sp. NPDC003693]